MSDLRTAAQQALEAFDPKNGHPEHMWPFHVKGLQAQACKALRAALAVAVDDKPRAWIDRWGNYAHPTLEDTAGATPLYERPAAAAEPDVPETRFGDMPERLRTYSADTELSDRYSDAMQEAADEIERLTAALAAAVAEERERCATLVEDTQRQYPGDGLDGWLLAHEMRSYAAAEIGRTL